MILTKLQHYNNNLFCKFCSSAKSEKNNSFICNQHYKHIYAPPSNLAYFEPLDNFRGCQIVHWDPLNAKKVVIINRLVWLM